MDYRPEIIFIALVAHHRIDGGSEENLTAYAQDLFDRFDAHIRTAAEEADLELDVTVRSVLASVAALVPGGTARECAREAVATYKDLFAS